MLCPAEQSGRNGAYIYLCSIQDRAGYTSADNRRKASKELFVPDYTPHALRHTWASWHYCVHKDILRLKADGDWSNINTVTVYAKLMPPVYRKKIVKW